MTAPKFLRFYFHIVGDGRSHRDDEGEVFATEQEARDHALRIARELRYDGYQDCSVSITDAEGVEFMRVPLGGVLR